MLYVPGLTGAEIAGLVVYLGVVITFGVTVYAAPAFVAAYRNHPNVAAIAALNILLGWTFIGWVAALVWALTAVDNGDSER